MAPAGHRDNPARPCGPLAAAIADVLWGLFPPQPRQADHLPAPGIVPHRSAWLPGLVPGRLAVQPG